jgi:hypothetical protein
MNDDHEMTSPSVLHDGVTVCLSDWYSGCTEHFGCARSALFGVILLSCSAVGVSSAHSGGYARGASGQASALSGGPGGSSYIWRYAFSFIYVFFFTWLVLLMVPAFFMMRSVIFSVSVL